MSRVRSGTGRAVFPLRPGVVESVRQSLALLRNALQAAFAAYPCRPKDGRLRYSTVGLTRDRTR
uniref:Uncharacterized protein n=1 Tax=Klebsiella aerogenes TaxID=548 RepID=A0A1Z1N1C5_KLEAE|nr:hypothetical protein [Klebsiella aerogenes]ARW72982.1 hypothetical protein [Klebsiella aerogenes]